MTAMDVDAVARLHAASWRHAYREELSDAFLAGPIDAERSAAWIARRHEFDRPSAFGLVAEDDGELTGFAYVCIDADPLFGHLLDNLHVLPDRHGVGLGRALLAGVATELQARGAVGGVYLWVYASNVAAQRFYMKCQATRHEQATRATVEGRNTLAFRYVWSTIADLYDGAARPGRVR